MLYSHTKVLYILLQSGHFMICLLLDSNQVYIVDITNVPNRFNNCHHILELDIKSYGGGYEAAYNCHNQLRWYMLIVFKKPLKLVTLLFLTYLPNVQRSRYIWGKEWLPIHFIIRYTRLIFCANHESNFEKNWFEFSI